MKQIFFILILGNFLYGSIGTITLVKGDGAVIQREEEIINAVSGKNIEKKDIISTDNKSHLKITMSDNTLISIGKNSALSIKEYIYDTKNLLNSKTELSFVKGAFKAVTGKIGKINPSRFKLNTRSAAIGIRGTAIEGDQETLLVTEGSVFFKVGEKTVIVNAGEISFIQDNIPTIPRKYTIEERRKIQEQFELQDESANLSTSINDDANQIIQSKLINSVNINNSKIKAKTEIGKKVVVKNSNLGTEIKGKNVLIKNSTVKSNTSVGKNSKIINSNIGNKIEGKSVTIKNAKIISNTKIDKGVRVQNTNLGNKIKGNVSNTNITSNVELQKGTSVKNGDFGVSTEE